MRTSEKRLTDYVKSLFASVGIEPTEEETKKAVEQLEAHHEALRARTKSQMEFVNPY